MDTKRQTHGSLPVRDDSEEYSYGPDTSSFRAFLLSFISSPEATFPFADGSSTQDEIKVALIPKEDDSGKVEKKGKDTRVSHDTHNENDWHLVSEQDVSCSMHTDHPLKKQHMLFSAKPDSSLILPEDLSEFLYSELPMIVHGCQWVLLYSTWKHGMSLHTLYRYSALFTGPCLLVAVDTKGAIFGGLLSSPLTPTSSKKYQGTNETFVFTNVSGKPMLFRPTGMNRYFVLCTNDSLAFGGGGSFALLLDDELFNGSSGPCETFGNCCLAHSENFVLKHVELWGFAHTSSHA